ncbi:MAG: PQQ-binding-like beta-propeller repeat protein [bacterium]
MKYLSLFSFFAVLTVFSVGFRMDGTSLYPNANVPTEWSKDKNISWQTDLPAWSNACPLIVKDKIFVCAEPDTLICLNNKGEIQWQVKNNYYETMTPVEQEQLKNESDAYKKLTDEINQLTKNGKQLDRKIKDAKKQDAPDQQAITALETDLKTNNDSLTEKNTIADKMLSKKMQMPPTHEVNGYSSNTPFFDGEKIYVCYGYGINAAYNLDGKRAWIKFVEKSTHGWGQSCSPLVVNGVMLVHYERNTYGLNTKDGEILWKTSRNHNWGSILPITVDGVTAAVTDNGDIINPVDGKTLVSTGFSLDFGSPLVIKNVIYYASNDASAAFDISIDADKKWVAKKLWRTIVAKDRYYASPLLVDGNLYIVNANGTLTVLNGTTGEKYYEKKLNIGSTVYPSPILAGKNIIISSDNGKAVVIESGIEYKEISAIQFEPYRTTPVADGKNLYIRTTPKTQSKLYCISEAAK